MSKKTKYEYEVHVNGGIVAYSTDMDEAVTYAFQYTDEGVVDLYELENGKRRLMCTLQRGQNHD